MNFPLYIGLRYLKSKRSHNVINVISWISIIGICVTTAALIIVLSVFNGFKSLVSSLYSSFEPDLKITVSKGKTFKPDSININEIRSIPEILSVTEVVEDNALVKNDDQQVIATIKGVSNDYSDDHHLDNMIIYGNKNALKNNHSIIGFGLGYYVGLKMYDLPQPLSILIPKRTATNLLNPLNAFNIQNINVNGVFSVQEELDNKYIIVPISSARELLEYTNEVTAIEIRLKPSADIYKIQYKVEKIVGNKYNVKNHFELEDTIYKVMHSEKTAIFIILTFIILIATFNLIGTLSMLIIDKEKDITILWSMGVTKKNIKKIFYLESLMMTSIGTIIGMLSGLVLCLAQLYFKIIKFTPGSSFVIDAYPVKLLFTDFIIVLFTVFIIGALTALIPISRLNININYNRK